MISIPQLTIYSTSKCSHQWQKFAACCGMVTSVFAATLSLGGCLATSDAGVALPEFVRGQAESDCALAERCMGVRASHPYLDGSCLDWNLPGLMNRRLPWIQGARRDGSLVYHPALARRCLDELNARGCDYDFDRSGTDCPSVFEGKVAAGSPCRLSEECAGDSFCNNWAGCPGVCTLAIRLGGICRENNWCEPGLFCNSDHRCIANWAPPIRLGAACDPDEGCDSHLMRCLPDVDDGAPTCVPAVTADNLPLGDRTCGDTAYCAEGLVCAEIGDYWGFNSWAGVGCQRPYDSGGPCHLAFPEGCPAGEYCAGVDQYNPNGTCTPVPTLGGACAGARGRASCAPGLRCFRGVCAPWRENGGPCSIDTDCMSGFCESGVCAPPLCTSH